jgi:hypothetical protein
VKLLWNESHDEMTIVVSGGIRQRLAGVISIAVMAFFVWLEVYEGDWGNVVGVIISSILAIIGGVVAIFWNYSIRLDLATKMGHVFRGWFFLRRDRSFALDRIRGVALIRQNWKEETSEVRYCFGLVLWPEVLTSEVKGEAAEVLARWEKDVGVFLHEVAPSSECWIDLGAVDNISLARSLAEEIAVALGVPLLDESTGHPRLEKPEEFGRPLIDRDDEAPDPADLMPASLASVVSQADSTLTVALPVRGHRRTTALGLLFVVAALTFVGILIACYLFNRGSLGHVGLLDWFREEWPIFTAIFVVVCGVFWVLLGLFARRDILIIEGRGLVVRRRHGPFSRTCLIPWSDLRDVTVPDFAGLGFKWNGSNLFGVPMRPKSESPGLLLRADTAHFMIGNALPPEEMDWLRAVIIHAARGAAGR